LSYGLVYSGVFITELLPEKHSIRRALEEGAETALSDREKARTAPKRKPAAKPAAEKPKRTKPATKTAGRIRKIVKARADQFEAAAAV